MDVHHAVFSLLLAVRSRLASLQIEGGLRSSIPMNTRHVHQRLGCAATFLARNVPGYLFSTEIRSAKRLNIFWLEVSNVYGKTTPIEFLNRVE